MTRPRIDEYDRVPIRLETYDPYGDRYSYQDVFYYGAERHKDASINGISGDRKLFTQYSATFDKALMVPARIRYSNDPSSTAYRGYEDRLANAYSGFRGYPANILEVEQNVINRSIVKAQNDLGDGKMQLGNDLLEIKSSALMVSENTIALLKAMRAARHANFGAALSALSGGQGPRSAFHNKYLEWLYGWLPTMGSIHDGATLIREGFNTKPMTTFVEHGALEYVESTDSAYEPTTYRSKVFAKTRIDFALQTGTIARQLNQLGLVNPAAIAWEALPYSFVLDWFIPIGQSLQALSAYAGVLPSAGYRTRGRYTTTVQKNYGGINPNQCIRPGSTNSERFEFTRVPGVPPVEFRPFTNANPFTNKDGSFKYQRISAAIALISQRF